MTAITPNLVQRRIPATLGGLFRSRSRGLALIASILFVLAIGLLDFFTGSEIGFSAFFLIPIGLVTWWMSREAGLGTAVVCTAVWLGVEFVQGPLYTQQWALFWNAFVWLTFFVVVVLLLAKLKDKNVELKALLAERTSLWQSETAERKRVEQEVIEISNNEKRRIAHDLHDGLGQFLTGIAFKAKLVQQTLEGFQHPDAAEAAQIAKLANDANQEAQRLARGLDPIEVEAHGLVPALKRLASGIEAQFGVTCSFSISPRFPPLDKRAALHLYRIAQEAFNNAIKHAKATQLWIDLCLLDSKLILTIQDNGPGLSDQMPGTGMGLHIMRYRSEDLGGRIQISNAPTGTAIVCIVPDFQRFGVTNQPDS
jgi:signal transduction histidine kinase